MKRTIVLYPGTFDPVTFGHLYVIKTASKLFSKVIIALLVNPDKKTFFSEDERKQMIMASLSEIKVDNVVLISSDELTVEVAKEHKASAIIRGARLNTDYENELLLSFHNQALGNGIPTLLIPPAQKCVHINSTAVRELIKRKEKERLKDYLPKSVIAYIAKRYLKKI